MPMAIYSLQWQSQGLARGVAYDHREEPVMEAGRSGAIMGGASSGVQGQNHRVSTSRRK